MDTHDHGQRRRPRHQDDLLHHRSEQRIQRMRRTASNGQPPLRDQACHTTRDQRPTRTHNHEIRLQLLERASNRDRNRRLDNAHQDQHLRRCRTAENERDELNRRHGSTDGHRRIQQRNRRTGKAMRERRQTLQRRQTKDDHERLQQAGPARQTTPTPAQTKQRTNTTSTGVPRKSTTKKAPKPTPTAKRAACRQNSSTNTGPAN